MASIRRSNRRPAVFQAALSLALLWTAVVRAQDADVVIPAGDPAASASVPDPAAVPTATEAAAVPAVADPVASATAPPVLDPVLVIPVPEDPVPSTEAPVAITEAPIPTMGTPVPTTSSAALPTSAPASASGPSSSSSASGSADAAAALPAVLRDESGEAETAVADRDEGTGSTLSRAKLIVLIVLSTVGTCVIVGLLGWCCTRKYRGRRDKTDSPAGRGLSPSALPVVVPEGILGPRGGPYGRSESQAMIAVMGDPVDAQRPSRLSIGLPRSHRPSRESLVPAYRLSRPLGSSTSPSSLRGTALAAVRSSRSSAAGRALAATLPYYALDYVGGASDAGSSADDRASYSSLVEFHQSARGGEGILTPAGSLIRTSTALVGTEADKGGPSSPSLAVLELHRFSGTSSTSSQSARPLGAQARARSIILRDLTSRPTSAESAADRTSSLSSSASGLEEDADGGADAARLEWYNSIQSPTEDDRYTRLSLGGIDTESDRGRGDRQSYEL